MVTVGTGSSGLSGSPTNDNGSPAPIPNAPGSSASAVGPSPKTQTDPGNLEYPDNVSAQYSFSAVASGLRASATFSGATALTLAIDCPDAQQSMTITNGSAVEVAGSGACVITLSELTSDPATVSYSLSIGQLGG
jgi:hypothetical protein